LFKYRRAPYGRFNKRRCKVRSFARKKYDYKRQFLIALIKEGETLGDQGNDGLRSSLDSEHASGLSREDDDGDIL
jgi:hypothetical protein